MTVSKSDKTSFQSKCEDVWITKAWSFSKCVALRRCKSSSFWKRRRTSRTSFLVHLLHAFFSVPTTVCFQSKQPFLLYAFSRQFVICCLPSSPERNVTGSKSNKSKLGNVSPFIPRLNSIHGIVSVHQISWRFVTMTFGAAVFRKNRQLRGLIHSVSLQFEINHINDNCTPVFSDQCIFTVHWFL